MDALVYSTKNVIYLIEQNKYVITALNPQKVNSFPEIEKHTESIWIELQ